jgi:hypothetical protein
VVAAVTYLRCVLEADLAFTIIGKEERVVEEEEEEEEKYQDTRCEAMTEAGC